VSTALATTEEAPKLSIPGRRKAAILLVALGSHSAAEVFKHLPEETIEKLTIEMARIRDVAAEEADYVQREMIENAFARGYLANGGVGYAREVLEKAVGQQRADEILSRLATMIEQTPFEFLRSTPPDQIWNFLRGEHPQTIALVLANLPTTDLAAKVMQLMPADDQSGVAIRIATMNQTSPDVVKDVANVMKDRLQTILQQEYAVAGGVQSLADILNSADRGTERNILDYLTEEDEQLADEVRSLLFTFEDILQLDERSLQMVLKEVDSKDLALALRGSSEDVKDWVMQNMSSRGSEMLKEEMEYMPPQRRRVVEEAQSKVVAVVRRLEDAGEITIARGGSDEDELVG
jgi:flagellar motor switch protein FliG